MTGRFGRWSVAAAAGLSVLLGGCDSSGDPATLPSVSRSTSGSPSRSAGASASPTAVPVPPAAARRHTSAGASEFVRFYIDLINAAYRTGASEPLRAYADDECDSCSSIADAVDEIYSAGSARGGQISIHRATSGGISQGVAPTVVVELSIDSFTRLDHSGHTVEEEPRKEESWILTLKWSSHGWHVASIRHPQGSG